VGHTHDTVHTMSYYDRRVNGWSDGRAVAMTAPKSNPLAHFAPLATRKPMARAGQVYCLRHV
jgi:hypothetical protein